MGGERDSAKEIMLLFTQLVLNVPLQRRSRSRGIIYKLKKCGGMDTNNNNSHIS